MRLALILLCLLTAPLMADTARHAKITAGFEGWMAAHNVDVASIAIIDADGTTSQKGYGRDANAPVTLASLSKAITGACVAALQQDGVFDLDAPVADVLKFPGAAGNFADFLSQTSGLTPDRTQGQPWHLDADRTPRHDVAARTAFEGSRADASFRYNNENYAVLGAAIDAIAQDDYATDCHARVLEPLGITSAQLDPVWGPLAAWGGWAMSPLDYARFAKEWYGPNPETARNIGRDPLSWPHAELGGGVHYVMGAFYRALQGRNLFWHAGLLCWGDAGDGSYFASYNGDPVVVVSYNGCMEDEGFRALDRALFEAAIH